MELAVELPVMPVRGPLLAVLTLALGQANAPARERAPAEVKQAPAPSAPLDWHRAQRLWRITVILRLEPSTAGSVFAALENHDRAIASLRARRARLMQEIQSAVDLHAGDATLMALVDRWVLLQQERREFRARRWQALARLLSLQQQAQLMVLLPRLDASAPIRR